MLYLIYGDTTPLQIKYEELLLELKGNHPGIKEIIFDASLNEIPDFFNTVSTSSMFSPYQLIILKRAEDYKNLSELAKSLEMYNLAQKDIIILYEEFLNDFGKRTNEISKKILTSFEKIGEIICFRKENEKKAGIFYLQKNLNISQNEAEILLDLIGDDYFKLKNETDKIKNFLDGNVFNIDKILPILSISKEANLKKLTESFILTQQNKELLNFLKEENNYSSFLYIITDELLIYLKLIILINSDILDRNVSYNKFKDHIFETIKKYFISDRSNIHPYYLFLKLKNVNLFTEDFLKKQLNKLLVLEYKVKSGELDLNIEIETFILSFFS